MRNAGRRRRRAVRPVAGGLGRLRWAALTSAPFRWLVRRWRADRWGTAVGATLAAGLLLVVATAYRASTGPLLPGSQGGAAGAAAVLSVVPPGNHGEHDGTAARRALDTRLCPSSYTFCETFDGRYGSAGGVSHEAERTFQRLYERTGTLDPTRWSVSRLDGATDLGQGQVFSVAPAVAAVCGQAATRLPPPRDVAVCPDRGRDSAHLVDAFGAGGGHGFTDAMVLQPLDFAGRTTTITVDLDASVRGGDPGPASWVEVWVTDTPAPGAHDPNTNDPVRVANAVGVLFTDPCTDARRRAGTRVPTVITVTDYLRTPVDTKDAGKDHGCIRTDGGRSHVILKLSSTRLEVWTSDPDGSHVRLMSSAAVSPSFTRGYLHLVHVQDGGPAGANAPARGWDNVGFDGPFLAPLHAVAVPDALKARSGGRLDLGWVTGVRRPATVVAAGVDLTGARSASLALSSYCEQPVTGCPTLDYAVNGHRHRFGVPDALWLSGTRGLVVPLALADLRTGTNKLAFYGDATAVANVDLYLSTG